MFIIKAGIMYSDGEVVEGRDYSSIDTTARKLGYVGEKIEGFVTSTGDFVLPDEAAKIAQQAKQVDQVVELVPEHLWSEERTVE